MGSANLNDRSQKVGSIPRLCSLPNFPIRVTVIRRLHLLSKMMIWLIHTWMVGPIAHLDLPPPSVAKFTRVWSTSHWSLFVFLVCNLNTQNILVLFRRKTPMTLGQRSPMPCARRPLPMMTRLIRTKIASWLTPCLPPQTRCGLPQRDGIVKSIQRSSMYCQPTLSRIGGPMRYHHSYACS